VLKRKKQEVHMSGWSGNVDIIDAFKHTDYWSAFFDENGARRVLLFLITEIEKGDSKFQPTRKILH